MVILPELMLLAGALAFFVLSLGQTPHIHTVRRTALVTGWATLIAAVLAFGVEATVFSGSYVVDRFSQLFKLLMALALLLHLLSSQQLKDIHHSIRPEYSLFQMLSVLGLMMLVSSVELITMIVSLELSSFALYLMVPMRNDRTGLRVQMEAGIKYVMFGVLATGLMLYGMSLLFGLTGSTYLQGILAGLSSLQTQAQPAAVVALVMILAGFFYKLAAFPLHFWVPDIYQGSANETAGFIATLPKFGAVALLIRFLTLPTIQPQFVMGLLASVALCSMFYGNLCALVQKDIKRMLGYSGIAHAGFITLGLMGLNGEGYGLAIYYVAGYVFMNLACFLVISSVSQQGENLTVADFGGLYRRQPVLAFTLAVGLFGLAGIPPFVGFMSKFMILTSALKTGHLVVVCLAAINTAIAIYYYLSVVKAAYTTDPAGRPAVIVSPVVQATGLVLVAAIIVLGILPGPFIDYAGSVIRMLP